MICGPGLCGGLERVRGDVWNCVAPRRRWDDSFDPFDIFAMFESIFGPFKPRPEQPAPIDRPAWAAEMDRKLDALLASRPQWEGE